MSTSNTIIIGAGAAGLAVGACLKQASISPFIFEQGDKIRFADGKEAEYDALILATGYRPSVNELLQDASSALDPEGTPTSNGKVSQIPGLYFCGYYVSPTGMLREIAMGARQISAAIVASAEKRAY